MSIKDSYIPSNSQRIHFYWRTNGHRGKGFKIKRVELFRVSDMGSTDSMGSALHCQNSPERFYGIVFLANNLKRKLDIFSIAIRCEQKSLDLCQLLKSHVTSLQGNKYVQLFCNRGNFTISYPVKLKSEASSTLDRFLHEVGISSELLMCRAAERILV